MQRKYCKRIYCHQPESDQGCISINRKVLGTNWHHMLEMQAQLTTQTALTTKKKIIDLQNSPQKLAYIKNYCHIWHQFPVVCLLPPTSCHPHCTFPPPQHPQSNQHAPKSSPNAATPNNFQAIPPLILPQDVPSRVCPAQFWMMQ